MPAVALDVMSGDAGLTVAIAAARRVRANNPGWDILLVGDETKIQAELQRLGMSADQWQIEHAAEVVSMDDSPSRAIRRRDTSMRLTLELVAADKAQAAISAGNTGALMGLGILLLRVIDGISRPAIASFIPNRKKEYSCCMLDLGANVKCTAPMLRDFALMGTALVQTVKKIEQPKTGLLNIGAEEHKGNEVLKETAKLLSDNPNINFIGNVEGYTIYESGNNVDVVVCDGFSGNVALKVSEGLAKMVMEIARDELRTNLLSKLCALIAYPLFMRLRRRFDHRRYNGAAFLGLRRVLVKSHGNADEVGFAAAIQYAIEAAASDLPDKIAQKTNAATDSTPPTTDDSAAPLSAKAA